MSFSSEIRNLKGFFASNSITLSDVWLETCVNWLHAENQGVPIPLEELRHKVYEQWLLLDLTDAETICLPPLLKDHKKIVLDGRYSLQMLHIVDISKPKYQQIQQCRNNVNLNSFEQKKEKEDGKRVLEMRLTDGTQEIDAFEYTPIPSLNVNMAPGIKLMISGPVTVRRGRIFLEEKNVRVLGGEVDDIFISNAAENVMAQVLGLPLNPNPKKIDETPEIVNEMLNELQNQPKQHKTVKQPPTHNSYEAQIQSEIQSIIEAEQDVLQNFFEEDADFTTEFFENAKPKENNPISLLEEEDDIFAEIDVDQHLDAVEDKMGVISIKDLKNAEFGIHTVKTKLKSVVQKLTVTDGKWNMCICVCDDTDEINVKLHNDVLRKLVGYECEKIKSIREEEDGNQKFVSIMQNFKSKLQGFDCKMDVLKEEGNYVVVDFKDSA